MDVLFSCITLVRSNSSPSFCLLVVVHSPNRSRSCAQDVRLAIPPDLTYDTLPLLQSLCPLQLLSWGKHVDAQRPVWLAGEITNRYGSAGQRDRCFYFDLFFIFIVLTLLLVLCDVLQLLLFRRGWRDVGPRFAGDADDQEAEGQHQAETHTKHKVQAETLWVC